MKVMFLSDLHLDGNSDYLKRDVAVDLIAFLKKRKPDMLVIAGDIAGTAEVAIEQAERIQRESGVSVRFVPGNHDVWVVGDNSSRESYNRLAQHEMCLIGKPVHLSDEWMLVGEMGWYDYSFGPRHINAEEYPFIKRDFWKGENDCAKWHMPDKDVCSMMLERIEKALDAHKDKKIVFATHFVPWDDFVTYKYDEERWNACNAFIGCETLGKMIDARENVKFAVFGHTHTKHGVVEYGNVTAVCNPIGYKGEWKRGSFIRELFHCAVEREF